MRLKCLLRDVLSVPPGVLLMMIAVAACTPEDGNRFRTEHAVDVSRAVPVESAGGVPENTSVGSTHGAALPAEHGSEILQSRTGLHAQKRLDTWLVTRYRGLQLLPDSDTVGPMDAISVSGSALSPDTLSKRDLAGVRIEHVLGSRQDTLVAVRFSSAPLPASLRLRENVRIVTPSGVATTSSARVIAVRFFRVPQAGRMNVAGQSAWRWGTAYIAALNNPGEAVPRSPYLGWFLVSGN